MKKIFASMMLLLAALSVSAQSNGLNPMLNIEVRDLTYDVPKKKTTAGDVLTTIVSAAAGVATDTHHEDRLPEVIATVKAAMSRVYRLTPVDMLLEGEEGLVVTGTVSGITTTQKSNTRDVYENGKKKKVVENFYEAHIRIALTLTHTLTGETETRGFNAASTSGYGTTIPTVEKALESAIIQLDGQISEYFNNAYPLRANIVERGEEKKDKQKELYIDLGSANAVAEDMNFLVYEVGEVAGREVKKEIGRVRVNEILGEDISICRVKKGGKDIKRAFDEGKKLMVVSKE